MKDVLGRVKRNWFTVMPEDAQLGKKGRVVVRFQIQKDGTLLVKEPTVELSSKDARLDKAATAAIRASAPFKPLPDAFQGPSIDLRFLFLYNVPNPNNMPHRSPRALPVEIILPIRVCAYVVSPLSETDPLPKFKLMTHYPIDTTVAGLYLPTLIKASRTSSVVLML